MKKIVVIDLHSKYIKTVSIEQEALQVKKLNLGSIRKKYDETRLSCIFNSKVDISKFKQHVLPKVVNHTKYISSKKLVGFAFIFTGEYADCLNISEVKEIINGVIDQYIPKNTDVLIKSYSINERAYLGFKSFLNSTFSTNYIHWRHMFTISHPLNDIYFFKNENMHLNIEHESTSITLFKGYDFSNTTSIGFGLKSFSDIISSIDVLSIENLKIQLEYIRTLIIKELNLIELNTEKIKLCVASGITDLDEGFEYKQTRVPYNNIIEFYYEFEKRLKTFVKTLKSLRKNNNRTQHHQNYFISTFAGEFLTFLITEFYNIELICLNHANYRIGVLYSIKK